jgi:hypothetical protein
MAASDRRPGPDELRGVRGVALVIRFVLEIALLIAYAAGAFALGEGVARFVAAVVTPLVVAAIWGLFLSPRSRFDIGAMPRFLLEFALFLGGLGMCIAADAGVWGAVLFGTWLADTIALGLTRPRP